MAIIIASQNEPLSQIFFENSLIENQYGVFFSISENFKIILKLKLMYYEL